MGYVHAAQIIVGTGALLFMGRYASASALQVGFHLARNGSARSRSISSSTTCSFAPPPRRRVMVDPILNITPPEGLKPKAKYFERSRRHLHQHRRRHCARKNGSTTPLRAQSIAPSAAATLRGRLQRNWRLPAEPLRKCAKTPSLPLLPIMVPPLFLPKSPRRHPRRRGARHDGSSPDAFR